MTRERLVILAVACLVACKVFFFSVVFPPFSNVDEVDHFDTVVTYAAGALPHKEDARYSETTARLVAAYGVADYIKRPDEMPGGVYPPPLYAFPPKVRTEAFRARMADERRPLNTEASSFPVYYWTAGLWQRLGASLGIDGIAVLYWGRLLNILPAVLLVGASYLFCRRYYPSDRFLAIALPLLFAAMPQDLFYTVTNDAFSSLAFLVAFSLLLDYFVIGKQGAWRALLAGSAVAVTFLIKASNSVIILLSLLLVIREIAGQSRRLRPAGLALFAAASLAPVAAWLARTYFVFGDPLAVTEKMRMLGWTARPFNTIFSHPLFSGEGFLRFWTELMKTMWRGELTWHGKPLALAAADGWYVVSTTLFLSAAAFCVVKAAGTKERGEGYAVTVLSLLAVIYAFFFLAALSVRFNFGRCFYPSVTYPYFSSGRLIAAVLVPFLILYLQGFRIVAGRLLGQRALMGAVVLMAVGMTWSEIILSAPVVAYNYNLIHNGKDTGAVFNELVKAMATDARPAPVGAGSRSAE